MVTDYRQVLGQALVRERRIQLEQEFARRGLNFGILPVAPDAPDETWVAAAETVLRLRDANTAAVARARGAQGLGPRPGVGEVVGAAAQGLFPESVVGGLVGGKVAGETGATFGSYAAPAGSLGASAFRQTVPQVIRTGIGAGVGGTGAEVLARRTENPVVRAVAPIVGAVAGAGAAPVVQRGAVAGVRRVGTGVARAGAAAERRGLPSPITTAEAAGPTQPVTPAVASAPVTGPAATNVVEDPQRPWLTMPGRIKGPPTEPPTGAAGGTGPQRGPVERLATKPELDFLRQQVRERMYQLRSQARIAERDGEAARLASAQKQLTELSQVQEQIRMRTYKVRVDPDDPAEKLAAAIETAGASRATSESLYSAERRKRMAVSMRRVEGTPDARAKRGAFLSAQAGPLPKAGFDPVASSLTPDDTTSLFSRIWDDGSPLQPYERANAHGALEKVLLPELAQVPQKAEIELLERVFGPRLSMALLAKRTGWSRYGPEVLDVLAIPKTLRSSIDVSAPMRQGVFLAARHPREWAGNMKNMFRALGSEQAANDIYDSIINDPDFEQIVGGLTGKQRLAIQNPMGPSRLTPKEEFFASRIAAKIPGIQASERAYVTFLNKLRFDIAKRTLNNYRKAGIEVTDTDLDRMTNFLNIASGRGNIGRIESLTPVLNAAFWSPRLAVSRFQMPVEVGRQIARGLRPGATAADRMLAKQMAEELAAFVGTGAAILFIVNASGIGRVELDPRSTDFGKIRIGGTTIDFWGGFQQMARYTAQFVTGEKKPTHKTVTKGYRITKDAEGNQTRYGGTTTRTLLQGEAIEKAGTERVDPFNDVAVNFLISKLAPGVPTLATSELRRKNFQGQKLSQKEPLLGVRGAPESTVRVNEYAEQLLPLFGLQLAQAVSEDGMNGGFTAAPGVFGVGVQTSPIEEQFQAYPDAAGGFQRVR